MFIKSSCHITLTPPTIIIHTHINNTNPPKWHPTSRPNYNSLVNNKNLSPKQEMNYTQKKHVGQWNLHKNIKNYNIKHVFWNFKSPKVI
jgi:hypothetical protein